MKVLHILYSGLGGHSNVFFSMVEADKQKEFKYEALFNGVETVRPDSIRHCEDLGICWHYINKLPGKHIGFIWRLIKKIRQAQADIIFIHGSSNIPAAFIATLFARKKQKIIVRETQANHLKSATEWVGLKLSLLLADRVVFLSEEYRSEIENKKFSVYRSKKIAVIPNGLNLDIYKPVTKPETTPVVLGMQSRLVAIKDHTTLLYATAILKKKYGPGKFILKIAGDGDYKEKLMQLTQQLSLQHEVHFLGLLKESELAAFLHSCDIYIHASLGETMSTAIMQAMACQLPVIASDVQGINNMLQNNKTGILIPPQKPDLLANAIDLLLIDKNQAQRLAANAHTEAQNRFSNIKMFESYRRLFY